MTLHEYVAGRHAPLCTLAYRVASERRVGFEARTAFSYGEATFSDDLVRQLILNLVLASAIAAPLGGTATGLADEPGPQDRNDGQASDAHRTTQILAAFGSDSRLHAFDFSVSVAVDRVVLGGIVDDDIDKKLAERIATDVHGIKFVVNHIVVDADYTRLQHARRD